MEEELKIALEGTVYNTLVMVVSIVSVFLVLVISKQGKDIEGLARALPNKTVAQCRNFFTNYKRKLNLPRLIAEYEIRNVSSM